MEKKLMNEVLQAAIEWEQNTSAEMRLRKAVVAYKRGRSSGFKRGSSAVGVLNGNKLSIKTG